MKKEKGKVRWVLRGLGIFLGLVLVGVFGYVLMIWNSLGEVGREIVWPGRKYLVVFQNEAELRPTGGFIGAYAVVETGWMGPKIEVRDSYFLEKHAPERAPKEVHNLLDDGEWYPGHYFRDANISPDWPTSARELMRMYNKNFEGEEEDFDGVIAVNLGLMEEVLEELGEFEIGGEVIDEENWFYVFEVALRPEDAHSEESLGERKDVLKDLAKEIMWRGMQPTNWRGMVRVFREGMGRKDIQIYFEDEERQEVVKREGVGGEMKKGEGDYLHVNVANYAGGKTDRYIDKWVEYVVEIDEKGGAEAVLRLRMKNRAGEGLFTKKWQGWVRVYIPQGAEVRDLGVETKESQELGKKVLSEVVELPLGEEWAREYRYRLPGNYKDGYELVWQQQSGLEVELVVDVRGEEMQRFWEVEEGKGVEVRENHLQWKGGPEGDFMIKARRKEDEIRPFIINQHFSDLKTLWVDVSEPLVMGKALITSNYEVRDLNVKNKWEDEVRVVAVEHFGRIIKLTLEGVTKQEEERYALTVKGQYDKAGNLMGEKTVTVVQRLEGGGVEEEAHEEGGEGGDN